MRRSSGSIGDYSKPILNLVFRSWSLGTWRWLSSRGWSSCARGRLSDIFHRFIRSSLWRCCTMRRWPTSAWRKWPAIRGSVSARPCLLGWCWTLRFRRIRPGTRLMWTPRGRIGRGSAIFRCLIWPGLKICPISGRWWCRFLGGSISHRGSWPLLIGIISCLMNSLEIGDLYWKYI